MRSFLLILATVVVLAAAAGLYLWMQPPVRPRTRPDDPSAAAPVRPRPDSDGPVLGAGRDVWVKRYDPKTGNLASQFRADRYDPQKDGTVLVDHPQAEFMLDEGRVLRVRGAGGSVIVPPSPAEEGESTGAFGGGGQMSPPTRGTLHDVVIALFASAADADRESRPMFTIELNNVAFDNDTFRITTEAYDDPSGRRIEADQVPVTVRGIDYDFDGRGLTIQWNDLNQRLELLEIAHGERLVMKNPTALSGFSRARPRPAAAMLASADPLAAAGAVEEQANDAGATGLDASQAGEDGESASGAPPVAPITPSATTAPARSRRAPTVYRAIFKENVRIYEASREVARGDAMDVEFLLNDLEAGDQQAQRPTTGGSAATSPATRPAHAARAARPASTAPTSRAASQPATAPAEPIIVRWRGKLRVTPLDEPPEIPIRPKQAVLRMGGEPLRLNRQGTLVTCGGLTYTTADQTLHLRASDKVDVVTMTDARGGVITTPRLDYSDADGTATLTGPSRAVIPLSDEPTGSAAGGGTTTKASADPTTRPQGEAFAAASSQPTTSAATSPASPPEVNAVVATWEEQGLFHLVDDGAGGRSIADATMRGHVTVDHPRLAMNSAELALMFEQAGKASPATAPVAQPVEEQAATAPSTQSAATQPATSPSATPQLRQIIATGAAHCAIKQAEQGLRWIDATRLELQTASSPEGQLYPRSIDAEGNVAAETEGGTLKAQNLSVLLKPAAGRGAGTSQPAAGEAAEIALESLTATGDVQLSGSNGSAASAEQLHLRMDEKTEIRLIAGAGGAARVTDGRNTLSGPHIRLLPDEHFAEVLGAGALHAEPQADAKQATTRPVDVTWQGGVTFEGASNHVEFRQQVIVEPQPDSAGAITTGRANRLEIFLADGATATAPATSRPAGDHDAAGTMMGRGEMGEFMKNKHPIRATLSDDVRVESTELSSEGAVLRRVYLKADVLTQDLLSNQTQVPGAGSMLVEDHRPRPRQAIPEERDAQGPEAMAGQNRGTTAFDWKKELSYEQSQRLATMRGDVVIRHVPDENEQGQAFRIEAQRVRAELEPPENPAAAAATGPAASAPAATRPVESPVGEMRVRKIIADDRVHVEAQRGAAAQAGGRIQIDADQIEYTPESAELIARGSAAQPVLISDDQGQWEGSIQEVHWNARTGHINITKGRARVR